MRILHATFFGFFARNAIIYYYSSRIIYFCKSLFLSLNLLLFLIICSMLCRYLHDEPINFISVSTARATLDAAHQYLCSGLAKLAVTYLENHLTPSTVLEIYQSLGLYANDLREGERSDSDRSPNSPTVASPGDDAGAIGMCGSSSRLRGFFEHNCK